MTWRERFTQEVVDHLNAVASQGVTYDFTDQDVGRLVVDVFGHEMRWSKEDEEWYLCSRTSSKGVWSLNKGEGAMDRALAAGAGLAEFNAATVSARTVSLLKSTGLASRALTAAKGPLYIEREAFDRDHDLLAVKGGKVVHLPTGTVRDLSPDDRITMVAGATYEAGAEEEVEQRILEICGGSQQLADFLRRRAGYGAVGAGRDHLVFIDHGPTGTAKSWVRDGEAGALGQYATTVGISTFTRRKDAVTRYSTAKLMRARLVTATELAEDQTLDDSLVKQMTGDEMEARLPAGKPFVFRPTFTARIATNHLPRIGGDKAVLKRLCVVPLRTTFAKNLKLEAWVKSDEGRRAFLAWIVKGAVEYCRNVEENGDGLRIPRVVCDYTEGYGALEDTFTQFFRETFTPVEGAKVRTTEARAAYEGWCRRNGEKPVGNRAFGTRMQEKGHPSDGEKRGHYLGLRLDQRWQDVNLAEERLRSGGGL